MTLDPSELDSDRRASRLRHLVFIAHLWLCTPFLIAWFMQPAFRVHLTAEQYARIQTTIIFVCVYLLLRTVWAFKDSGRTRWELVFPPLDVVAVSALIWTGNGDPISHVTLLYFFPVAEAAGLLSVGWSLAVAAMVAIGAGLATHWFVSGEPFVAAFRYFFFFLFASLATFIARIAAANKEQLGVERDRARIALEMHDGVQGHLVSMASRMELASLIAKKDPETTASIAKETRDSARLAADELRFLVHRLRAPSLSQGFTGALKQFSENVCQRADLELTMHVDEIPALKPEVENTLFRISQEFLTNTLKHAEAKKVFLSLRQEGQTVKLELADDGKGFDDEAQAGSSGIEGMRKRAADINAKLSFYSVAGRGTNLDVAVPL